MSESRKLIEELLTFQRYNPDSKLTKAELLFQRFSRFMGRVSAVCFVAVGLLLVVGLVWSKLPDVFPFLALFFFTLAGIAGFLAMICDAIRTLLDLFLRKQRVHHKLEEFKHDEAYVSRISEYPISAIAEADVWLGQQAQSIHRRMSLLAGKEYAIFGVVIALLSGSARQAATNAIHLFAPDLNPTPERLDAALIAAFVLLLIGAMGVKFRIAWYEYLRGLIKLAEARRTSDAPSAQAPTDANQE